MNNPAFNNDAFRAGGASTQLSAEQLTEMYERPSAGAVETDRMTMEDTLLKSAIAFGILVAGAVIGWMAAPVLGMGIYAFAVAGFVLALVNIFKKEPSPGLILGYAAAQGIFIGGLSAVYDARWEGIVFQAVIATIAVVGVTLALFASGKIRASARMNKIFLIAMLGYAAFSLINLVTMLIPGVNSNPWGMRGAELSIMGFDIKLGVVLGLFAILLGAYSLVMDFDFIQKGIQNKAPRKYGWTGVFGVMLTVVWLYLEILRLLAISRD